MRCQWSAAAVGVAVVCALLLAVGCAEAAKCGEKCMERTARMVELRKASDSGVITITAGNYKDLLQTRPRQYDVILVLNALNPARQCTHCKAAQAEFQVAASSFYRAFPDNDDLFFASVDFDGNEDVFRKLKCQSAPVFFHVPPSGKPVRHNQQVLAAEDMATYFASVVGKKFPIYRPPNYGGMIISVLILGIVAGILYAARSYVLLVVSNPKLWAWFAIMFALLMMSGHMWLQIRGAPYMVPNKDGTASVFAGSSQYQYGAESHAVMLLYGICAAGVIFLNETAIPAKEGSKFRVYTVVGCAMVFLSFSYLYACFRVKYPGYPFRLLF
ncbi:hypothetical protein PTSG_05076 [Salpingoeca rosetta]|uniref:Uncharacterized protein n=1 Tax=Salpingoeca rosetta (strain ATCC 50818 / BSB-021) TaxID=946362 RepID=F2UAG4_SALR5|nr:uncharacterized protein PTSG_05076 [Salpingoeca rosetta]EGD73380.1 hypothetical protein PTSG_05076 [Salpingoeca rosetta]|eukprot:XP_004993662.1 hypothetical protein PTSG_05076 [Salpingoeca rosetta]